MTPRARRRVLGTCCRWSSSCRLLCVGARWLDLPEPLEQVVANAQRVGHCRQRRVHGAGRGEEAGVDYVEVVYVVGFAVDVERGPAGIGAEAHGAALVRDAGDGDLLAEHRPTRDARLVAAERT